METVINAAGRLWSEQAGNIVWLAVLVVCGPVLVRLIASKIVQRVDDGDDAVDSGREKRAKTLASLFKTAGNLFLFIIALAWTLRLFGVDPYPIIAGAGVLGFAVGFGAQTLSKDFFAGALIFAENQFAVGDHVKIGATEGTVHQMSVRTTVLRDMEGNIVFIPNGSITTVINYSLGARPKRRA